MNRGEARAIMRELLQRGHSFEADAEAADAAIIATCVVIDATERKMLRRIRELNKLGIPLLVTGCAGPVCFNNVRAASSRALMFHPGDLDGPVRAVGTMSPDTHSKEKQKNEAFRQPTREAHTSTPFADSGEAVFQIPISTGCNGGCSYCLTRVARGRLRSRPVETIVREARQAIAAGAVEIQLCAQDSAIYGADAGSGLKELVGEVSDISGNFMIRVGMMNPSNAILSSDDLIELYGSPKVFKFLHLPVQSGDDGVLESMERGYRAQEALELMQRFRRRFTESTISTDIIVGFPGEGEEAHNRTIQFLKESRPDIVNITRFSRRPNTEAAKMESAPEGRTVKVRSRELTILRSAIARQNNEPYRGHNLEVLVTERGKANTTIARTRGYKQVILPAAFPQGSWQSVTITRVSSINLFGFISRTVTAQPLPPP